MTNKMVSLLTSDLPINSELISIVRGCNHITASLASQSQHFDILTHEKNAEDLVQRFRFYQEQIGSSHMQINERLQSSLSINCPSDKRPEAFRSGERESVAHPYRGGVTNFLQICSQKSF